MQSILLGLFSIDVESLRLEGKFLIASQKVSPAMETEISKFRVHWKLWLQNPKQIEWETHNPLRKLSRESLLRRRWKQSSVQGPLVRNSSDNKLANVWVIILSFETQSFSKTSFAGELSISTLLAAPTSGWDDQRN